MNKDLDLSPFGIYQKEQITENIYNDNCFITAAINSKLFTNDEINYMREIINTRYLPREELKFIAETFKISISIIYFNEQRGKMDKAIVYGKEFTNKNLKLLLRYGHYMIYDNELIPENKYEAKNLNTLIQRMLNANDLELIEDIDNCEKFFTHEHEFQNLEYYPTAVKLIKNNETKDIFNCMTCGIYTENHFEIVVNRKKTIIEPSELFNKFNDKTLIYMPQLSEIVNVFPIDNEIYSIKPTIYRKTIQQIKLSAKNFKKTITIRSIKSLTSIDCSNMNLREFTTFTNKFIKTIKEKLNISIENYSTLPKMSFSSAFNYGCFDGIYELSGVVQSFAKKCLHGGIIKTLFDNYFEVNDVVCLDINSSYGTSMKYMQVIPIGKPKVFYNNIPEDSCYSLIQCEITNIKNDKLGRFTFISEGINFIDSILLEEFLFEFK